MRQFFASGFGLCAWLLASMAFAGPQFVNKKNHSIDGYDVVAYFTQSKPVKGDKNISAQWNGALWLFASEENKALFLASPEKYAPAYDGHCAFAAAQGKKVKVDPTAWKIVEGRLFLNYSDGVQKRWEKDIPGFIKDGDANWSELEAKPAASPGFF